MSYKIEGNLDFFHMLNNELTKPINNNKVKRCLISKQSLNDTSIKLMCGHEFNYMPLYREIIKQKLHHNHLSIVRLKKNQLQCPYCRNIQEKVLPYKPYDNVDRKNGVNGPPNYEMLMDECTYIFKSGKRKNVACSKQCNGKYCNGHYKMIKKKEEKKKSETEPSLENIIIHAQINIQDYKIKDKKNGDVYSLDKLLVKQLKQFSKQYNIKGYYKMKKQELVNALHNLADNNKLIS
jgi:hypothetical protein